MKEMVLVTGWSRPDFLEACLRRLEIADDGEPRFVISLDRGHSRDVSDVAMAWSRRMGGRATVLKPRHPYNGNSFNVLSGYRFMMRNRADLLYLVEDDVMVGRDFFSFHRAAHEVSPKCLSVSACRNQQFPLGADPYPVDDTRVYEHLSYQSLGVSFRREVMDRVLPHARPAYFRDPIGYCKMVFPGSAIPAPNAEQDGLIHRVGERDGLPSVYPCSPRAYHAGFVGYHRGGRPLVGSVSARADQILGMSSDEMNAHAEVFKDHEVVDLDADRCDVSRVTG
ncbi:hypothetical protein [Rhodococcus qingshengii]|uniref:hypothetical protein n=1 Tax=Rhodococcus qingshengii TaxID=334542 RepID=UPI0035D8C1A0